MSAQAQAPFSGGNKEEQQRQQQQQQGRGAGRATSTAGQSTACTAYRSAEMPRVRLAAEHGSACFS